MKLGLLKPGDIAALVFLLLWLLFVVGSLIVGAAAVKWAWGYLGL